jgi:hypothetical protein
VRVIKSWRGHERSKREAVLKVRFASCPDTKETRMWGRVRICIDVDPACRAVEERRKRCYNRRLMTSRKMSAEMAKPMPCEL